MICQENIHCYGKTGASILMSDKANLRAEKITESKKGRYIMIKGSIPGTHNNLKWINK